jgi:hypothetical protein
MDRLPVRSVARVAFVALAFASVIAACSEESQTDFTDDNETGFLAACSEPVEDAPLIGNICRCVFEQSQADFPFEEFTEMDEVLKADPEQDLQAEINVIIANCVISEAEL